MTVERSLRLVAGTFVVASAALGHFHSPYWLLLTAFVGLNLFQSGITNWCPMVWILERAGLERCEAARRAVPRDAAT
jgi:hypothetical protein